MIIARNTTYIRMLEVGTPQKGEIFEIDLKFYWPSFPSPLKILISEKCCRDLFIITTDVNRGLFENIYITLVLPVS